MKIEMKWIRETYCNVEKLEIVQIQRVIHECRIDFLSTFFAMSHKFFSIWIESNHHTTRISYKNVDTKYGRINIILQEILATFTRWKDSFKHEWKLFLRIHSFSLFSMSHLDSVPIAHGTKLIKTSANSLANEIKLLFTISSHIYLLSRRNENARKSLKTLKNNHQVRANKRLICCTIPVSEEARKFILNSFLRFNSLVVVY